MFTIKLSNCHHSLMDSIQCPLGRSIIVHDYKCYTSTSCSYMTASKPTVSDNCRIIADQRIKLGLSKKALGLMLGYRKNSAGQVISKIEAGTIRIPERKIQQLIEALGLICTMFGIAADDSLIAHLRN